MDRDKLVKTWDTTPECAEALKLLMSAKKPVDGKRSYKVLDEAEKLLRAAWETAEAGN